MSAVALRLPLRHRSVAVTDAVVALAAALAGVADALLAGGEGSKPLLVVGVLVVCAALAVRRTHPLTAFVMSGVAMAGVTRAGDVADHAFLYWAFSLVLPYAVARYTPIAFWRLFALGAVLMVAPNALLPGEQAATNIFFGLVVALGAPLLLGRTLRERSHLHAELRDRRAALEADRERIAGRAMSDERARIAAELHDVIAHALSAMTVQATGARRLVGRDPAAAGEAFGAVEHTGRDALAEIRRALGVLRAEDDAAALAPQPRLDDLPALLARSAAAGLPAELEVEGAPREVDAAAELTAYRLVQEALAAARDQGGAGHAWVRLRHAPDALELEVRDDGRLPTGRQLLGVRERVGLHGGRLRAGHVPEGHVVAARLPVVTA